MVEEGLVPDPHVVEHEVARLVIAHPEPRGRPARGRGEVVNAELVRLGFHQPECHRLPFRAHKRKRRRAPALSSAACFLVWWSPPSAPLEPIPEPIGPRWSLSGHIRYIRRGTRSTVTLGPQPFPICWFKNFPGLGVHHRGQFAGRRPTRSSATEPEPDRASPPSRPFYA